MKRSTGLNTTDADMEMAPVTVFSTRTNEDYRLRNSEHACATGSRNPNKPNLVHGEIPILLTDQNAINSLNFPKNEEENLSSFESSTRSSLTSSESDCDEMGNNAMITPQSNETSSTIPAEPDLLMPSGPPENQDLSSRDQEEMSDSSSWEMPDVQECLSSDTDAFEVVDANDLGESKIPIELSHGKNPSNSFKFVAVPDSSEKLETSYNKLAETDPENPFRLKRRQLSETSLLKELIDISEGRGIENSTETGPISNQNTATTSKEEHWDWNRRVNRRPEDILNKHVGYSPDFDLLRFLTDRDFYQIPYTENYNEERLSAPFRPMWDMPMSPDQLSSLLEFPDRPSKSMNGNQSHPIETLRRCDDNISITKGGSQEAEALTESIRNMYITMMRGQEAKTLTEGIENMCITKGGNQVAKTLAEGIEKMCITGEGSEAACHQPQSSDGSSGFCEGPSTSSGITGERSLDSLGNGRMCIRFGKKNSHGSVDTKSWRRRNDSMKRRSRLSQRVLYAELSYQEERYKKLNDAAVRLETSLEQLFGRSNAEEQIFGPRNTEHIFGLNNAEEDLFSISNAEEQIFGPRNLEYSFDLNNAEQIFGLSNAEEDLFSLSLVEQQTFGISNAVEQISGLSFAEYQVECLEEAGMEIVEVDLALEETSDDE